MAETFAAVGAAERALAAVQSLVFGQMVLVLEGLLTIAADKRTFARMLVFVASEGTLLAKHLVTLVAGVQVSIGGHPMSLPRPTPARGQRPWLCW